MATVVYCDPDVLGRVHAVWAATELGVESPLEFDEEGYALVEHDEAAEMLVRRRSAIEFGDPDHFEESVESESATDADADDESASGAATVEEDEASAVEPPVDPTQLTVAELREAVADVDSVAALEAIGDAEEAGENRASALAAIDGRISAVRE